ncbi:MAG: hydrogenase maturation nickel metallochaperone HypA [Symploca sp. SIO2E6]|nr:hydrogenase maturation nickel metallochaperone HypA [Symploca sp. SIO2E6]
MNQNNPNLLQLNLSGTGCWLTILVTCLLLGTVGLGFLVKGILLLLSLILILPVVGWLGFRWWLGRNLIADQCPVCGHDFTALNQTQFSCPNCGESLKIEQGHFSRFNPPGTIDVEAVDVSVKQIEQ